MVIAFMIAPLMPEDTKKALMEPNLSQPFKNATFVYFIYYLNKDQLKPTKTMTILLKAKFRCSLVKRAKYNYV